MGAEKGSLAWQRCPLPPSRGAAPAPALRQPTHPCALSPPPLPPAQTRKVACYEANGASLPDAECQGAARPLTAQACTGNCSVHANSSDAAPATSASAASSGGTTVIVAACAAGAALVVAAATAGFLLHRRGQRRRQAEAEAEAAGTVKWHAEVEAGGAPAGEGDIIPLPKHLRPIATGRRRSPRGGASGQQTLTAAAGPAAVVSQAAAAGRVAAEDAAAYAAALAQLQQHAPEYHVVHMPSPRLAGALVFGRASGRRSGWGWSCLCPADQGRRFMLSSSRELPADCHASTFHPCAGQDTSSPSAVRRSLRQRSPTRRPREGSSRATPDLQGEQQHRLAHSSSNSGQHARH